MFVRKALRLATTRSAPLTARASLSTVPVQAKKFMALRYKYVDGMLDKRAPHRAGHLERVGKAEAEGKIALGGAFNDPCDGALVLFHEHVGEQEINSFAEGDPYVTAGLVTDWSVSEYMAVAGSLVDKA